MITIRASSLPLALSCPASLHVEYDIDPVSPAASVGNAVHEALALLVQDKPWDAKVIAAKHSANEAEMLILTLAGGRAWGRIKHLFPTPQTETGFDKPRGDILLTGHPDMYGHFRTGDGTDLATVLDWKTTRSYATNYTAQVMGYLWLLAEHFSEPGDGIEYQGVLVYLRDNTVDVLPLFSKPQLDDWFDEKVAPLADCEERFCPGGHCQYCPRLSDCPAARSVMNQTALALTTQAFPATVEELLPVYQQVKSLKRLIGQFESFVRAFVARNDNCISDGETELVLLDEVRDEIDIEKAFPLILDRVTKEQMPFVLKLRKTELLKAVAENCTDGSTKKATREAFMQELTDMGAVTPKLVTRLVERKVAK